MFIYLDRASYWCTHNHVLFQQSINVIEKQKLEPETVNVVLQAGNTTALISKNELGTFVQIKSVLRLKHDKQLRKITMVRMLIFNNGAFISYYDHVREWHTQNLRIHTQFTTDLRITYDNHNHSIEFEAALDLLGVLELCILLITEDISMQYTSQAIILEVQRY